MKLEAELKKYGNKYLSPGRSGQSPILSRNWKDWKWRQSCTIISFHSRRHSLYYVESGGAAESQMVCSRFRLYGPGNNLIIALCHDYRLCRGLMGALGLALAVLLKLYEMFFNMPSQMGMISPVYSISGSLLSPGLRWRLWGCRSVPFPCSRLQPCGLRAFRWGKKILLEKLPFVWNILIQEMAVRNIIRNEGQTFSFS